MKPREALGALCVICVLCSTPRPAAAGEARAQGGLTNPFFAMCTGTRDSSHPTPESRARMLRELGYAGTDHMGFGRIAETLNALDREGLKLFAVYATMSIDSGGTKDGPSIRSAIESLARSRNGRDAIIWLALTSRKHGRSSPRGDRDAVEFIRGIADMEEESGLKVALYPHTGFWLERVEDAVRVARKVGRTNVGVTFNLCHWLRVDGENLQSRLKLAMPHLFVVTVNGSDYGGKDWKSLIQTLDRGTFDTCGFLRTLTGLGYTGPVGLQGYGIGGDVRDNLRRSMGAWRRLSERLAAGPDDVRDEVNRMLHYRFGRSRKALASIETRVRGARPEEYGPIESALAEALSSPVATEDCKRFVCRMLRRVGTARSVPALSRLLADEKLSHMARFALERMAYASAGSALREALGRAGGEIRAGIISSIAARGDRLAVPALAELLGSADTAQAALGALGRIGGPEAARALREAKVPKSLQPVWADACLTCAGGLLAEERASEALPLYEKTSAPEVPEHFRMAAYLGLIACRGDAAVGLVTNALTGEDEVLRSAAVLALRSVGGPGLVRFVAERLPSFPPAVQVQVIAALSDRGEVAARTGVAGAAHSGKKAVRIAALQTLGVLGDASSVETLASAAAEGGKVGGAALKSLARLSGPGVDEAILAAARGGEAKVRLAAVRSLSSRGTSSAVPSLAALAEDPDGSVRVESLKALGALAERAHLPGLLELLARAGGTRERKETENAIVSVCKRIDEPGARADLAVDLLVRALRDASPRVRSSLLRVLGRIGGREALEALRAGLKDRDEGVRDTAVRVLAGLPDAEVLPDLLRVARDSPKTAHRVLAIRGLVRLVGRQKDRPAEELLGILQQAMAAAPRVEEKRLVISGLAELPHIESFRVARSLLDDDALGEEAAVAAVGIARALGAARSGETKPVLEGIARQSRSERLRRAAQDAIDEIAGNTGWITTWEVSGPYTSGDVKRLLDTAFPPEKPDAPEAKDVNWRRWTGKGEKPWIVDLQGTVRLRGQNRVAYLRATIPSRLRRRVVLEIGSDDGVKAWLNGEVVHANNTFRACAEGQDKVKVTLKEGTNTLLVKITQAGGEWKACVRVRRSP